MCAKNTSQFLTAKWLNLAIINYEIDPIKLSSYVPTGTQIDQWNGKTYISLVGFNFIDTKLKGIPVPFHRNFEEVNLRFYVRRKENKTWKRGVVFIKEIVPKAAIAFVARLFYNENYIALDMTNEIVKDSDS